jgi:hypothetical protein
MIIVYILTLYDTLMFTYGNGSGLLRILILVKITAWILDLINFRMIGQFDYIITFLLFLSTDDFLQLFLNSEL